MQRQVKPELTGERDLALNNRHRLWGFDCPAVDIDLLMVEYDHASAVAIVEYKRESASVPGHNTATMTALRRLADKGGVPFYVARYSPGFGRWEARAGNANAKATLGGNYGLVGDEEWWVRFLYRLRGRDIPPSVLDFLRTEHHGQ